LPRYGLCAHGTISRPCGPSFTRKRKRKSIGHITNGVHVPTWLSPQMRVYDRHFDPPAEHAGEPGFGDKIERIDDGEPGNPSALKRACTTSFAAMR
jgi:starch phosphorylase